MKRKIFATTLTALILMTFATGCNSGYKSESMNSAGSKDWDSSISMDMTVTEIAPSFPPSMNEEFNPDYMTPGNATPITQNKKIIKNGSLDMTAKDVETAYDSLLQFVNAKGGYEFSRSMNGNSYYKNLRAVFKVPPTELDAIIAYAGECGEVINTHTDTDDITAEYTDIQIRLETKKKALDKYYGFLADATTMDEIIMLQQQIDYLTADIESYEGRIRLWNSQISESTLEVYIQQEDDPDRIPEDIEWDSISLSTMGRMMKNGFVSVVNGIISVFQWLIIGIVTISPVAVPVIIVIVILISRHNKKVRNKAKTEAPVDTEN